ncbi:MAG: ATP synthase F0 subunit B [Desulfobacterales bacterium]
MKGPDASRRCGRHKIALFTLVFSMLIFWCGPAMAVPDEHAHGETAVGWVATDTYRVINFTILAAGLFFLLRKPVVRALNARITGIKNQLSELEAKKEAAEKELAAYHDKLAQLEKEAEKIVAEYVKQGDQAKERILKEAELTAVKMEEKARRNIEHEFKQAKRQLQSEVLEQALEKAQKTIVEKITSEDHDRLVDEYIEKVVA